MKKKTAITSTLILFGGLILYNFSKSYLIKRFFMHYTPPAVTVSSVIAQEHAWHPHIHAVGTFVAIHGVDVNAQTAGSIVDIHFESGQTVEQNAPLVDLDDRIEQSTLKAKQSELALQRINFQRQHDLLNRGAAAKSMVDEAEAKLLQAEADLEKTLNVIRQKHIVAPFSGRLGIRQINLGQYVTPGQTSIVSLQSMDPLYLEFYLPEQLMRHIHPHQRIFISTQQSPHLVFEAHINAINAKVDTTSHNVLIQATLANCPRKALKDPEHSALIQIDKDSVENKTLIQCNSTLNIQNKITHYYFMPGMFASIDIPAIHPKKVLLLPSTAISYSLYGNAVFVVHHDSKNPKKQWVERSYVRIGEQEGNNTVILEGLSPGQEIVSTGALKLREGSTILVNNEITLHASNDHSILSE